MKSIVTSETELLASVSTALPSAQRVLAFAPHPDDEIFGCGGMLCRLAAANAQVTVIIVTDGAAGGDDTAGNLVQTRAEESRAAAAALGLPEPTFWGLPDRGIAYGEILIERIKAAIDATHADFVLLPSPTELHPDHQVLGFAGAEALRRLGGNRRAAFYEISAPLSNPNLVIDISQIAAQKKIAMGCFPSQLQEQPYDIRIEGLNRFRSYFLGAQSTNAEAFLVVEAVNLTQELATLFDGPLIHRQNMGFVSCGKDTPLVSIIVRSMNRPTLSRALDSLALQTWPNLEAIVVNAAGGEHSPLPDWCGRFPLRLVNQGGESLTRPRAANVGLTACRGVYLGFLDDDDSMDPDHLQHLVTALHSNGHKGLAYAGVRGVSDSPNGPSVIMEFKAPEVTFIKLLLGNLMPIHAVLFSGNLLGNGVGFDETFDLYEDWDFWLQLTRQTAPVFVDRTSTTYYANGDSQVGLGAGTDSALKQQATEQLMIKWLPLLTPQEFAAIGDLYHQIVQALAEKEVHTAQLLAEKEAHTAALQYILDEKSKEIDRLQQSQAEREVELARLYASHSWRITTPLRWGNCLMRRGGLLLQAIPLAIAHAGGLGSCLNKGVEVARREGINGVRRRLRLVLGNREIQALSSAAGSTKRPLQNANRKLTPHLHPVDIIVCVHNAREDVQCCLESVQSVTAGPYRLIIVDDGSDPDTAGYLAQFVVGQQASLIRHEVAKGYTCAANAGLRVSKAPFVILLNSDTIVTPRWLDRLVRCAESDPCIGMAGPLSNTASWQSVPLIFNKQGDWTDNPLPQGMDLAAYAAEIARESNCFYPRVGFLNGFCLLIKRELLTSLGLFDEENFGPGYGEENDYCLRAVRAQWQLAVADDCFIYHAQSKSYSSERRKKLAALADQTLDVKHGPASIQIGIDRTRHHHGLAYIRQRCSLIPDLLGRRIELMQRYEGQRVLFLLLAGTAGGGGNIVLLECSILRQLGVDAWIANLQKYQWLFEQSHPGLDVPVAYLTGPEDLVACAQGFDAVIATLYLTVFWMKPLRELERPPRLGYYLQDFEPDFFEPDSPEQQQALASYTEIPEICLFTKTRWNAEILRQRLGLTATVIGPSVALESYNPSPFSRIRGDRAVRIVAMVRPSTPRRAPELTMRVLKQLKQRFQERIAITIFGVDPGNAEYGRLGHDFEHDCRGELPMGAVWQVLADADVFVDCSSFQAMGLTAMEAMASGVAVVGPQNGGLGELIQHGVNGFLVDTSDQQAIVSAVVRLIDDSDLRWRIQEAGLAIVAHHPVYSAGRILDRLFAEQGACCE